MSPTAAFDNFQTEAAAALARFAPYEEEHTLLPERPSMAYLFAGVVERLAMVARELDRGAGDRHVAVGFGRLALSCVGAAAWAEPEGHSVTRTKGRLLELVDVRLAKVLECGLEPGDRLARVTASIDPVSVAVREEENPEFGDAVIETAVLAAAAMHLYEELASRHD